MDVKRRYAHVGDRLVVKEWSVLPFGKDSQRVATVVDLTGTTLYLDDGSSVPRGGVERDCVDQDGNLLAWVR